MAKHQSLFILFITFVVFFLVDAFESKEVEGNLDEQVWNNARATFYGDMGGNETMRKFSLYLSSLCMLLR